tara:strand:+ start:3197 stop:4372 length:1176 start_codon:yes stop_codon:yes gene_type:complete
MAITTSGDLSFTNVNSDQLISAFNPCILEFSTDVTTAVRATVEVYNIGGAAASSQNLTPSGLGVFYFDFSGILKNILSEADNYLEPQYNFPDITTTANSLFSDNSIASGAEWNIYIYDNQNNVVDTAGSGGYYFMKGSTQVGSSPVMNTMSSTVGTGGAYFNSLNLSSEGVIVYKGFPLDIQFDALNTTLINVSVGNVLKLTKSISVSDENNRMFRQCLIDSNGVELSGMSDNTMNDLYIQTTGGGGRGLFSKIDYRAPLDPDCCKYFRFTNINGGQAFFLFENAYQTEVSRRNLDSINRRFNSLETASSRIVSTGNTTRYSLICHHQATNKIDNDYLQAMVLSPIIELWLGGDKWQRVNLISSDADLDSQTENKNYSLSFDLGVKYNQSI